MDFRNRKIAKFYRIIISIFLLILFLSCDEPNNGYTGPWQEVPTPGGEGELRSCYFNSPDDGWATGIDGDGGDMIFIHWNGNTWEEYQYPGWFDSDGNVVGITLWDLSFSSPDDGWCVGSVGFSDRDGYSFILRYDGNDWYVFYNNDSIALSEYTTFYHVYAISANDAWVTYGYYNSDLYHWNGTEMEFYNLPGNYGLTDIAFGSSDEGLAVGYENFIFHWDGVSWEWIDDYNFGHDLEAVAYDTPNSAWIVGEWTVGRWENGEYIKLGEWDGGWRGVHFSHHDEGWMFGTLSDESQFGHPATWHWDGVEWTMIEKPDDMRAKDIFSIDYDNAWIVGENYGYTPYCSSWRYQGN